MSQEQIIESCFVDWTTYDETHLYFSFTDNKFLIIENLTDNDIINEEMPKTNKILITLILITLMIIKLKLLIMRNIIKKKLYQQLVIKL